MLETIKNKFARNILLGDDSYYSVIMRIKTLCESVQPISIKGSERVDNIIKTLESETPILGLSNLLEDSGDFSVSDMNVKSTIDQINEMIVGNRDLNFRLNLGKEEHIARLSAENHPDPLFAVRQIQALFETPESQIKHNLVDGYFDNIQSSIIEKIKQEQGISSMQVSEDRELKPKYNDRFVRYNPVGVLARCNSTNYGLVEGKTFEIIKSLDGTISLKRTIDPVNIPDEFSKLAEVLNTLPYDPESETFTTSKQWMNDIICLKENGEITLTHQNGESQLMDIPEIKGYFMNTLQTLSQNIHEFPNFNRNEYLQDADNFLTLANNQNFLLKFDNIETLKDLNKFNESVMYNTCLLKGKGNPELLSWTGTSEPTFDSYRSLAASTKDLFQDNSNMFEQLFKTGIENEVMRLSEIQKHKTELHEQQELFNKELKNIRSLKILAEQDSPAYSKLCEQEEKFNNLINDNIEELKNLQ